MSVGRETALPASSETVTHGAASDPGTPWLPTVRALDVR